VDWKRAARAAAALGVPIAVATVFGHILPGALAAIGALCGTVTSISGPYRDRARRSGMAVLAGAIGFVLGGLAGEHGTWTAVLIVGVAALSAVLSTSSNNASLASLQLLIYVILGTHESTVASPAVAVGWYAAGAGWALLLAIGAWPVRATAPERALVANVFDRLAETLSVVGTPEGKAARHRLTASLNSAYDALLAARSRLAGRDRIYRRLFIVLSDLTPAVEATVALLSARHRPPRSVVDAVTRLGAAVRADARPGDLGLPDQGSPAVLALVAGLRAVADVLTTDDLDGHAERPDRKRPGRRERIELWFDKSLAGRVGWQHAARLAVCMAVAEVVTALVPLERSYWLPLTVATVLKPDFGSVFARAVLRGGGTALGAVFGAAVVALNPNGWVVVLLAGAIAFLLPITQVRHFGMFSTALTPLVIILLEVGHHGGWDLLLARLTDTAVGCVIVLVFGYLLWPGSRTPRIGGRLADAVDAVANYTDLALRADPKGRSVLRRRTYRQLSDLRAELQRILVEPSAAGRLASAWYPAIIGLERVTGSVTRVVVDIDQGDPVPPGGEVDAIVAALRDIAESVRAERPPAELPTVECEQLRAVMANLAAVVRALRGPVERD
jgi:uncharacterized membrane protein YccC